jgi:hypothetical protein
MKFLRALWLALVRTACLGGRVTLLLVWLLLLALFYLQTRVATLETLELPDLAKRELQQELMERLGLRADFTRARFDWSGRLVLENVRLGVPAFSDPLVTARRVEVDLDRWLIFTQGGFDSQNPGPALSGLPLRALHELRVFGATLAARAADGTEAGAGAGITIVEDLDFALRPGRDTLALPFLFARIGKVAVTASGTVFVPPRSQAPPPDPAALLAAYLRVARQIHAATRAPALPDSLRLDVMLRPSASSVALADVRVSAGGLQVSTVPRWPQISSGPVVLTTTLPLASTTAIPLVLEGAVENPLVDNKYGAAALRLRLRAEWRPADTELVPQQLEVALDSVALPAPALNLGPTALTVAPIGADTYAVSVRTFVERVPLSVEVELDAKAATARVRTLLTLDNRLVALAERLRPREPDAPPPRPLATVIDFTTPARLDARADLAFKDGIVRLLRADGWLDAGAARAEGVAFDAAGAHVVWDAAANRLVCDDAFLRIGESEARGAYEMDTATLDYRFRLAGRLRPPAIDAWMGAWWPEFWQRNFAFPAGLPTASLDLVGRWRSPLLTVVHVAVAAPGAVVRGVPFDLVRARLFIRPGWTDGLAVEAAQTGGRGARGAFTLSINRATQLWRRLEFSGTTDLDLALAGPLLGPEAAELVAPFRFDTPPRLVLSGQFEEQTPTGGWGRRAADIAIESAGGLLHDGFPVRDLVARAQVRDDTVELPALSFGFAGGRVEGSATLSSDAPGGRRIKFDGRLEGANLGEAIRTLENYSAARHGQPPPAESRFQQQIAGGTLHLTLAAEGAFARPVRLRGGGRVKVTGADFGRIRLLGLLSTLLDRTLLNFVSPRFDALGGEPAEDRSVTDTAFTLDGETVAFEDLWLTGPEAALMAVGAYRLDTQTLDFRVQVLPFEKGKTLVAKFVDFLTSPLSAALEVRLTGSLAEPDWRFVHGPASLLRALGNELEKLPGSPSVPPSEPAK